MCKRFTLQRETSSMENTCRKECLGEKKKAQTTRSRSKRAKPGMNTWTECSTSRHHSEESKNDNSGSHTERLRPLTRPIACPTGHAMPCRQRTGPVITPSTPFHLNFLFLFLFVFLGFLFCCVCFGVENSRMKTKDR